jgi:hypothetical protein
VTGPATIGGWRISSPWLSELYWAFGNFIGFPIYTPSASPATAAFVPPTMQVTKEGKVTFTGRLSAWWDDLTKGSPIIGMIVEGGVGSIPVVGTVIGIYEAYEVVSDANSSGKDRVIAIVGVIPGGKLVKILARVGGDEIAAVVAKVEHKQVTFGNAWEDAMQMAIRLQNTFGAARYDDASPLETLWRPAAPRSEIEQLQTLLLKAQLGVPTEILLAEAGYTDIPVQQAEIVPDDA